MQVITDGFLRSFSYSSFFNYVFTTSSVTRTYLFLILDVVVPKRTDTVSFLQALVNRKSPNFELSSLVSVPDRSRSESTDCGDRLRVGSEAWDDENASKYQQNIIKISMIGIPGSNCNYRNSDLEWNSNKVNPR